MAHHKLPHNNNQSLSRPPSKGQRHHHHFLGQHGMQVLEHLHNSGYSSASAGKGNGVIYTQASDFVLPEEVRKQQISDPVSARPMGDLDLTANDWVLSSGAPSREELHLLKKHAKQTAHALGTSSKKVLGEAHDP
ncbi:hypothetical protein LPJ64_006017 [Coemansia asiatica]|uniref:Uncharacterized protein n=1 Tax=Coemansia asiatica TaxID=1052880 RepID=A0A9W7XF05_9FUNG|nr:hypothetical protein LPJ64_006017 [Coemansia asiatica]KAJ2871812.1 hypothetical protein FB639_004426 [Coemansia asiatica]